MIDNVYFNGKKIIGVEQRKLPFIYGGKVVNDHSNRIVKVYVFDDGGFIKAVDTIGHKFTYICSECGKSFEATYSPDSKINGKERCGAICRMCLSYNHNGFKGKTHSQELKDRLSNERKGVWCVGEKNAMYGKSWTDYATPETIEARKQKIRGKNSGKNNPMYGKNWKDFTTQEVIERHSQRMKEAYKNLPEEEKERRRRLTSERERRRQKENPEKYREEKSKGGKSSTMKQSTYKKSSCEKKVEEWLIENNIDYNYSPIMGGFDKHFQYDFIIRGKRILIEVNGDYWHGNPNFFNLDGSGGKRKLNETQLLIIEKDNKKLQFAKEHNFVIVYIWEEEINNGDFSKLENLKND